MKNNDKSYSEILNQKQVLKEEFNKISSEISSLLTDENVQEYIKLYAKVVRLKEELKKIEKIQRRIEKENCNHPLWYYAGPETPDDPNDKNNKYICLECGEVMYDIEKYHKFMNQGKRNKIIYTDSYTDTKEEYEHFKEEYQSLKAKHGDFIPDHFNSIELFVERVKNKKQR